MDESNESVVIESQIEGFSLMTTLRFTAQSRILENACCPDKSLIVVISNDETREKLSLWSLNGAMRWEVELQDEDQAGSYRVVSIAWSPCMQLIAVAHHPPRITVHSIHDGKEKRNLVFTSPLGPDAMLTGLWWTNPPEDSKKAKNADVFERKGIVTGSALSVMRSLPLLDHIVAESQRAKTGAMFAFQAFQMPQQPDPIPKVIQEWSSLPSNPTLASIQPPPDEETPESLTENYDTLFAADSHDKLYVFLGGSYSLGSMHFPTPIASLVQAPQARTLIASHLTRLSSPDGLSLIWPTNTSFALLQHPVGRQLAQMSTVLKDLSYYVLSTLKDMRRTWFGLGRPGHPGPREYGEKFVKALEIREEGYKTGEMTTMLDLTILLAAGIRTKGMEDLLANSEHTSDRGLQKWETTVAGALTSLRDSAERRLIPAFQRIHMVLEDLHGLQQMSEWQALKLNSQRIKHSLDLVPRGMLLASWLAACARREASRVNHFIAWLRYEGSKITTTADPPPVPVMHHDIVEVNEYLMKGLIQSDVDRFFTGPLPTFSLNELSGLNQDLDLASTMERAERATQNPSDLLRPCEELPPLSRHECNVELLASELVQACFDACQLAPDAIGAYSTCRSFGSGLQQTTSILKIPSLCVRERYITRDQHVQKYIAIWDSSADVSIICIVHFDLDFTDVKDTDKDRMPSIEYALRRLDPSSLRDDGGIESPEDRCAIQGLEFFDEHEAVLVCKVGTEEGARIVRWHYDGLLYAPLAITAWRCEDVWDAVLEQSRGGDIPNLTPAGSCLLDGGHSGVGGLAVNGHPKREVACVLDAGGMTLRVFDMEKDSESEDVGEDAAQVDMEGVSS